MKHRKLHCKNFVKTKVPTKTILEPFYCHQFLKSLLLSDTEETWYCFLQVIQVTLSFHCKYVYTMIWNGDYLELSILQTPPTSPQMFKWLSPSVEKINVPQSTWQLSFKILRSMIKWSQQGQ